MTKFENSINRDMTREKYIKIRDKVYGSGNTFDYTYGDVASWLVWNRNENGEIANVKPPAPKLTQRGHYYDGTINDWEHDKTTSFASRITTDIVFLGLNMSGDGKPFIDSNGKKWSSFQNARGHRKIVNTFFGTEAEGAYFTDIIKPDKRFLNKIGKPADSSEVMKIIDSQRDVLNDHITLFKEELDFIGAVKPLLIVFGGQTKWILKQGLDANFLRKRFYDIVEIWHYAYINKGGDVEYIIDTSRKLKHYITISCSKETLLEKSKHYGLLSLKSNIEKTGNSVENITDQRPQVKKDINKSEKKEKTMLSNNSNGDNLQEKIEILKIALEKRDYTIVQKELYIASRRCDGAFFLIALSERNGFTFHWESWNHDRTWFDSRKDTIEKIFPGSFVEERRVCRLWIPVDQGNYKDSIINIVDKTRSLMGYPLS